jgi:hypothetical protein
MHVHVGAAAIRWLLSLSLASAVGGVSSLHAQRTTSIVGFGAADRDVRLSSAIGIASPILAARPSRSTVAIRLVTAIGGTVVGFFAGGTVGYQLLSHDCGGCDDPGLDAFIYGVRVGVPVGAALGAAALDLGSVCSFGQRTGRALLGAVAGGAVGLVAGAITEGAVVITFPVFSIGGALGSLGRCWKSEPQ